MNDGIRLDWLDLDALTRGGRDGVRRHEIRRRQETAEIVAANRKMLRTGSRPDELAAATNTYRRATKADRRM